MNENVIKLFSLKGKTVVITGGSGILGTQMGKFLQSAGANIVILDRNAEMAKKVSDELNVLGGNSMPAVADVLIPEDLIKAQERILERYGSIDILINAAGGNQKGATVTPDQTFFDIELDALRKVYDLNFFGTVVPTKIFAETMAKNKSGVILNVSSMAAIRPITRVVGYSAAKASIDNFTKWLAVEMANKFGEHIRINAIAPGFFITEQNRELLTNKDGSYTERGNLVIEHTPMDRFGEPEDLDGTILWLCSDAARFVTGIVVPVDGGFSSFAGV